MKEKKKVLPNIVDEDGEASSDDIKFLGAWRNVNDKWKIYPCEISAKRCKYLYQQPGTFIRRNRRRHYLYQSGITVQTDDKKWQPVYRSVCTSGIVY